MTQAGVIFWSNVISPVAEDGGSTCESLRFLEFPWVSLRLFGRASLVAYFCSKRQTVAVTCRPQFTVLPAPNALTTCRQSARRKPQRPSSPNRWSKCVTKLWTACATTGFRLPRVSFGHRASVPAIKAPPSPGATHFPKQNHPSAGSGDAVMASTAANAATASAAAMPSVDDVWK